MSAPHTALPNRYATRPEGLRIALVRIEPNGEEHIGCYYAAANADAALATARALNQGAADAERMPRLALPREQCLIRAAEERATARYHRENARRCRSGLAFPRQEQLAQESDLAAEECERAAAQFERDGEA